MSRDPTCGKGRVQVEEELERKIEESSSGRTLDVFLRGFKLGSKALKSQGESLG